MTRWLDSRWRAHVINAARNVMSHGVALTAPSGIGLRVRLRLAAGRVAWAEARDAVAGGGERADLSPYLPLF